MKYVSTILWIQSALVLAVVLYVLSSGPAWYFIRNMDEPINKMRAIYYPTTFLGEDANNWIGRYIE